MQQASLFDLPPMPPDVEVKSSNTPLMTLDQYRARQRRKAHRQWQQHLPPFLTEIGWELFKQNKRHHAINFTYLIFTKYNLTINETVDQALHASLYFEILDNDRLQHYWHERRDWFCSYPDVTVFYQGRTLYPVHLPPRFYPRPQ